MLWCSLEAPRRGASNEHLQHMFKGEIRKILCGHPLLSGAMPDYAISWVSLLFFCVATVKYLFLH